eukprot:8864393-Pyramimonas_sp.AAC.1
MGGGFPDLDRAYGGIRVSYVSPTRIERRGYKRVRCPLPGWSAGRGYKRGKARYMNLLAHPDVHVLARFARGTFAFLPAPDHWAGGTQKAGTANWQ